MTLIQLPHFLIPEVLGGGAFLFLLGGIYLCRVGARNQEKYDYLKDPPHVWINGIPRGLVQIRGRVQVEDPLISPLTHAPSCYYHTTIEREKPGKPGYFKTVYGETKHREFTIDDGTGKIMVMPAGADYELSPVYSAVIDLHQPGLIRKARGPSLGHVTPPSVEHLSQFLARHGIGPNATPRDDAPEFGVYRVTERCLTLGEETSVFGMCAVSHGPRDSRGRKVLCKDEHLPTLLVTKSIEINASRRMRYIAIASFTSGVLMIGLSLASALLLIYPRFA